MARAPFVALGFLVLAGCAGSAASPPVAVAPPTPAAATSTGPVGNGPTSSATMVFTIPSSVTKSHVRYLSSATTSVVVTPSNGAAQTFTLSPVLSAGCTTARAGQYSCTVNASVGANVTFDVKAYNSANALLSHGVSSAVTVAASNPTPISVTLNGVATQLSGCARLASVAYGAPSTGVGNSSSLRALDASGNAIGGTFDTPLTIAPADAAWSTSTATAATDTALASLQFSYTGGTGAVSSVVTVKAGATTLACTSGSNTLGLYHAVYAIQASSGSVDVFDASNLAGGPVDSFTILVVPPLRSPAIRNGYVYALDSGSATEKIYQVALGSGHATATTALPATSFTALAAGPVGQLFLVGSSAALMTVNSTFTSSTYTSIVGVSSPFSVVYDSSNQYAFFGGGGANATIYSVPPPYNAATQYTPGGTGLTVRSAANGYVYYNVGSQATLYQQVDATLGATNTLSYPTCSPVNCAVNAGAERNGTFVYIANPNSGQSQNHLVQIPHTSTWGTVFDFGIIGGQNVNDLEPDTQTSAGVYLASPNGIYFYDSVAKTISSAACAAVCMGYSFVVPGP